GLRCRARCGPSVAQQCAVGVMGPGFRQDDAGDDSIQDFKQCGVITRESRKRVIQYSRGSSA
ncbi:hypothetical protein, partial [Bradyrhizobium sp. CER78]|uniref:hypothetical protein n=1 Tax=Bradyrhizobium sp. CER78 TaxID=3039162 RepID=UPI002449AD1F